MATPRARFVNLAIVVELIDRESGHWCNDCALPSGWRVLVSMSYPDGRLTMHERLHCDECGGHNITLEAR